MKPEFDSLDELRAFVESHDLSEYWDQMPEVNFEIDIQKETHLFSLDAELAHKLTEIAKSRQIPSEALINVWLKEKVLEQV